MGVLGAFHVTRTIGMLTLTVFMAVLDGVVFARDFQHFDFEKINLKEQMVFNGKPLHYIKDADEHLYEWDEKAGEYRYHDVDKHHHHTGHHHKTIIDFDPHSPPKHLLKDDDGHELIEIVNKRDFTRWVWMYDDGNFHDADISLTPDHIKSLSHYQAPTLAYHPYHGPFITQQLINATKAGDYQRVLEIFKKTRVDPNQVDEYGNSALHYAHAIGHSQLICLLGTHHSDFSLENNKGQTPYDMFEEAADNAEDAVFKTLLENTAEEIILANYRFTEHSGHDFWEPGAKFESADSENWDPTTGRYLHHIPGQPVGVQEPDKLDL